MAEIAGTPGEDVRNTDRVSLVAAGRRVWRRARRLIKEIWLVPACPNAKPGQVNWIFPSIPNTCDLELCQFSHILDLSHYTFFSLIVPHGKGNIVEITKSAFSTCLSNFATFIFRLQTENGSFIWKRSSDRSYQIGFSACVSNLATFKISNFSSFLSTRRLEKKEQIHDPETKWISWGKKSVWRKLLIWVFFEHLYIVSWKNESE